MRHIKPLIIFIVTTIVLFCCKSEPKQMLIVGKWRYEKNLNKNAKPEFGISKVMVTFNKDGSCISNKGLGGGLKGVYELINNGESLITQMSNTDRKDTVRILSLTSDILEIENSAEDSIQFKKIE